MKKSIRLEIRLTPTERAALELAASQAGVSMSALIREILATFTTNPQPTAAQAQP